MYHPFFIISDALAARSADCTIVTANDRLAAEVKRSLDAHFIASGKLTWPTADVVSYRHFFSRRWHEAEIDQGSANPRLSEPMLRNLAYAAAPEHRHGLSEFIAAWRVIDEYDIDLTHPLFERRALGHFVDWLQSVRRAASGHITDAVIPDRLRARRSGGDRPLILIGFDQYTHPQRRYFEWLSTQVDVLIHTAGELRPWSEPAALDCEPSCLMEQAMEEALEDAVKDALKDVMDLPAISVATGAELRDELRQASTWARAVKLAQADATIGIVVPNLAQQYDLVLNQCSAIFDPQDGARSTVFDIAGGTPLDQQPVWQHALLLLNGATEGWTQPMLREIDNSQFIQVAEVTAAAIRWRLPRSICATARLAEQTASPQLVALAERVASQPPQQSFAQWCRFFSATLDVFDWPVTNQLGSAQYQAAQRILGLLESHATLAQTHHEITASDALYLLNLDLRGHLFSPERPAADIRILGLLETTGLNFTHLWVCGLDENSFPGAVSANPFLPLAVCQQHGVPRASQVEELAFAERLLTQWQTHADTLVISYTNRFEDSEQRLSPLVLARRHQPLDPAAAPSAERLFDRATRQEVKLVAKLDVRGTPVLDERVHGGTGLINAQAACPFRAYGQYRLQLRRPEAATDYPDSLARGTLLHLILQRLVTAYPAQAALLEVSHAEIEELCRQTLGSSHPDLPTDYARHEVARLASLIQEWLVVEARRQPFTNLQVESSHELALGDIRLKIRIDRIDELAGGARVVIDYKTGRVRLPGHSEDRLTEPQLPLYSLTEDRIRGVYFGQIRADGARLVGIADASGELTGARTASGYLDFPAQREQWRRALASLAQDFKRGYAVVDPLPGACDFCHLQSLCRINELDSSNASDDGERSG